ncbi:MAG: hypothetical protein ACM3H8_14040, partial [Sphingobacteriales bacterium]
MINRTKVYLCLLLVVFFTNCNNNSTTDSKNTLADSPKFELVKDWPQLSEGYILSQPTGIGIDTSQNIFVFH